MKEIHNNNRIVRKMVWNMHQRNLSERRDVSFYEIKRRYRIQLAEQYPDLSMDAIEAKIGRIMRKGLRPTQDTAPGSPGIPVEVLAVRKIARKIEVKKRKRSRR